MTLALLSLFWAPWRGRSTRAIDALLIAVFGMPALLGLWLTKGRSPGWLRLVVHPLAGSNPPIPIPYQ